MPHTFLATAYDLGDATSPFGSVHTRYKQEIARRLGLSSRALAYGDSSVFAGPRFVSASLDKAAATVTLQMADTGEGGMVLRPMRLSALFPQARALCGCIACACTCTCTCICTCTCTPRTHPRACHCDPLPPGQLEQRRAV